MTKRKVVEFSDEDGNEVEKATIIENRYTIKRPYPLGTLEIKATVRGGRIEELNFFSNPDTSTVYMHSDSKIRALHAMLGRLIKEADKSG